MSIRINRNIVFVAVTIAALFKLYDCGIVRDSCGPGWDTPDYLSSSFMSQSCYKFVYQPLTLHNWYSARHYCKQDNAELLVIDNAAEAKWLQEVFELQEDMTGVHSVDHEATAWYVDAHKQLYCDGDEPCWRDGRLLDYDGIFSFVRDDKPYAHCRDSSVELLAPCYAISFDTTTYPSQLKGYDLNCSTVYSSAGFVCKRRANNIPNAVSAKPRLCTHDEAVNVECPAGWRKPDTPVTLAPYCYKFVPMSKMSWDGAYRECARQGLDSALLYVEGALEAHWVTSTLTSLLPVGNNTQRYAINMHAGMNTYGLWSFPYGIDVTHSGFTWEQNQPDKTCGQEWCTELMASNDSYTLNDIPCSTVGWETGYICKRPACVTRERTLYEVLYSLRRFTEL